MFKSFLPVHEALVERSFVSAGPPDLSAWADLGRVLDGCRAQVVEGLKSESEPELRRQLRLLYEGLTIATDFLDQEKNQLGVRHIPSSCG